MYFTKLPDHSAPGFNEEEHFSLFSRRNIIFNATAYKSSCDDHVGCLSLKTVFHGEEQYKVDNIPFTIRPGQYLLLNGGQNYGSSINSNEPVKSFSIFFTHQFAADVYKDCISEEQELLDNPFHKNEEPAFYQKLHFANGFVHQFINSLITQLDRNGYEKNCVDENLGLLLYHLLYAHRNERKDAKNVKALKKSTQAEIYKRLCIAKDVMQSCYDTELDLETISRYALMSVPQLVRQFRTVFKQTPHQYLTHIRMEQACQLLRESDMPITEITTACSFHDHSAFSRLFRKTFAEAPDEFRKLVRN